MTKTLLVYLHGFRSSPRSSKAVMTGEGIKTISTPENFFEWYCPQLLASPRESMAIVEDRIHQSDSDQIVVVGRQQQFDQNQIDEFDPRRLPYFPAVRQAIVGNTIRKSFRVSI